MFKLISKYTRDRSNSGNRGIASKFTGFTSLYDVMPKEPSKLVKAVVNSDLPRVQVLVITSNQSPDNLKRTPLHWACAKEHFTIVNLLLEYNADLNAQDQDGFTPLMLTALTGNIQLFNILLTYNSNISLKNYQSQTALHLSVIKCHDEITHILLSKVADFNALDNYGFAPIHYAIREDNLRVLSLLIDEGANVDLRTSDSYKDTPLIYACKLGRAELVDFMIACRADFTAVNARKETGYTVAVKENHAACIALMREAMESVKLDTQVFSRDSSGKRNSKILERGIDDVIFYQSELDHIFSFIFEQIFIRANPPPSRAQIPSVEKNQK
ncbi:Ankyrin-2 [Cichlidogyrus casuarinus]|uniref:Ankyrin-2 n=1 Tax=Cichlidogyrus casuarinus TaxID=1844966 RepID=A0ABD2Q110_9PLAT